MSIVPERDGLVMTPYADVSKDSTHRASPAAPARRDARRDARRGARPTWREVAAVVALVALAVALRLTLVARGWPILNSDEATMGLMGSDVLHRGAHPVFFYGQNYMGALQAYLVAPLDALLGPTPLALRTLTTLEVVAFLLVVYALARAIWSPAVGLVSVGMLALGPEWALLREAQAGVGAQDTLLFGALVVWLALLRLGAPQRRSGGLARALALDTAFGLAAGLGLWGDFLFLPYLAAALLGLLCLGLREWRVGALRAMRALGEVALGLIGFVVGAAPFILTNVSSGGQTLRHAFALTQAHNGAAAPGSGGALALLAGQFAATLLVGLPQALGSVTVCPGCAVWPAPGVGITSGRLAQELAFAAPFSLIALGLWLWSALPLARALRRHAPRIRAQWRDDARALPPLDTRWWGRLMLTLGGALTLLQYLVSRTSYSFPASSARYLIGLYICAPLVAAPLVAAFWAAVAAMERGRGEPHGATQGARSRAGESLGSVVGAPLGVALLLLILIINAAGAAHALAATGDRQTYGQPMGQRDTQLVAFLHAHSSEAFYAGYWTCLRLVFASQQQVSCAVIDQHDAFKLGFNRYPPAVNRTLADPHPAWVFDLARGDEDATVPGQVAACIAAGEPRCAGYTSTTQNDYLIFYYAGPPAP